MTHDSLGGAEQQRNIGSRGSSPLRAKLRKLDRLIHKEKYESQFWFLSAESDKKKDKLAMMDAQRAKIRNQLKGYAVEGE